MTEKMRTKNVTNLVEGMIKSPMNPNLWNPNLSNPMEETRKWKFRKCTSGELSILAIAQSNLP